MKRFCPLAGHVLLVCIALILTGLAQAGQTNRLVDPSDCDNDTGQPAYCNIQAAIDASSDGDLVEIVFGTFYESLDVGVNLTLQGQGIGLTAIDGSATEVVVSSNGNDLTLRDLSLQNGLGNSSGCLDFSDGSLQIERIEITHCKGDYGGGANFLDALVFASHLRCFVNDAVMEGGCFYANQVQMEIANSTIENNSADLHGGGISFNNGGFSGTDLIVRNNDSGDDAGGVGIFQSNSFSLSDSRIENNIAEFFGGGIHSEESDLELSRVIVVGNEAYDEGGGAYFDNGTVLIDESWFHDNYSLYYGAGFLNDAEVLMIASAVTDNIADSDGGAIENYNNLVIANSTVSGNHSGGIGGGIDAWSGEVWLYNVTLANNSSEEEGGGLYIRRDITIANSILADNQANDGDNCYFGGFDLVSLGYNLIGDDSCDGGSLLGSDQTETDPMLNPLAIIDDRTAIHSLHPMSPAINGGNPDGCLDHEGETILDDQRGHPRPVGDRCDIGAFEFIESLYSDRFEAGF